MKCVLCAGVSVITFTYPSCQIHSNTFLAEDLIFLANSFSGQKNSIIMTYKPHIIATLGATGQTGRVVVRHLLAVRDAESLTLQIYVRSKIKLQSLFPGIDSNPHVKIYEGSITDLEAIENCCRGADTIICTLGENMNIPGVRVMQDAADGIITSLKNLKATEKKWQRPRLLLLSSSTYNARFAAARPPVVHWLIKTAFSHPYADLAVAQTRFQENPSLVSLVLIQPPLLIEEEGTGHEISTESVRLAVSYEDLGAAFVELVLDDSHHTLSAVGVSSKLGDRPLRYAPEIFRRIFRGMLAHIWYFFFPVKAVAGKFV